jgi:uncharacterized protein
VNQRWVLMLGFTGLAPACHPSAPAPPQPVEIGTGYEVTSEILSQVRRINVYLPPGYTRGNLRYPVLYLLDGGVDEDFIHIAGIASLAADFRRLREFIVVGIESIDRYHDLVHPAADPADRVRLPTSGGSAAFRSFIRRELRPFVESRFRVSEETVLIGESAAGLFVLESFLREPDLFAGYIAVSPMLWWDDQSLVREATSLLGKPFPPSPRLYLTIGDEGGTMRSALNDLVHNLKARGRPDWEITYAPMEHESHGTIFHPAALAAIREFFAIPDSATR